MHFLRLAVAAVLALWLGCTHAPAAAREASVKPTATATDPLRQDGPARFLTLSDIRSRIRSTSQKLVLLHLWATWCGPCIEELPTIVDLSRSLPGKGIELLSVSMDDPTRHNAARVSQLINKRASGALTRAIARIENADAFINGLDPRWEGSIPALMAYLPSGQLVGALYGQATSQEFEQFIAGLIKQGANDGQR